MYKGICCKCGKPCTVLTQQDRISDEFGIQVHDAVQFSDCCESDVEDVWEEIEDIDDIDIPL